ncbi:MBL fold metallo-hydrolase [Actinoplanes sp. NPDC049598]|uniref:pyrroloquinoline quinone biosynthesis protein PqqB n=1 Tax=Actinoplanes sp. NPDC049598 TaxID=3154626 RepID=UPI003449E57E
MRVRVLGSAAGGGCPQWNCACATCRRGHHRLQDSVAVSGDGRAWYLINASPDIRAQLLGTPELRPGPGLRETPVRGVLLTTAELDHTIGLLSLREAVSLVVYATTAVTTALAPLRALLAAYSNVEWRELPAELDLDGGLKVRRLTVGAKRPRYAAEASGDDWVSALRLSPAPPNSDRRSAQRTDASAVARGDRIRTQRSYTNRSFVYATCLPAWTEEFHRFIAGADEVLLDGTFQTDDELTRMTGRPGSAASMGHLPMAESRGHFARHPGTRFRFGHLNNTNDAAGPDVAEDGIELI